MIEPNSYNRATAGADIRYNNLSDEPLIEMEGHAMMMKLHLRYSDLELETK